MGRQTIVLLALMGVVGASLAGCKPRHVIVVSDQRPQPVSVLRRYNGTDPGLKEPLLLLVNSAQDLESLGSYDLAVHAVDFDKESLVLLALGEKPTGGYWARITGVQREGQQLYVQGLANRPSQDQAVTQALTYPYDAVVISKIRHAKVLSEIESLMGKHPQEYRAK